MFSISTKLGESDNRVFFQCPKCHSKAVYFVVPPEECDNCGESLPDPDKMEKDKRTRYNYHIYNKD